MIFYYGMAITNGILLLVAMFSGKDYTNILIWFAFWSIVARIAELKDSIEKARD